MTWSDCDCDEYIIRLMNEWMCNFVHLSESESVMRSSSSSVLISSSSSICVVSYSIISSSCKWDSPSMNEANLQKRRINGFFFFDTSIEVEYIAQQSGKNGLTVVDFLGETSYAMACYLDYCNMLWALQGLLWFQKPIEHGTLRWIKVLLLAGIFES